MPKLPSFQFYPGDWQKDPDLRRCSKAAKGMWMDMICLMFECPVRGTFISGDGVAWLDREIAEAVGGDVATNLECLAELLSKGVAKRNAQGAIFSRRLVRDEEQRRSGNERVRKHRSNGECNAVVTPPVTPLYEEEGEVETGRVSGSQTQKPKPSLQPIDREAAVERIWNLCPKQMAKPRTVRAIVDALIDEAKLLGAAGAIALLETQTAKYKRLVYPYKNNLALWEKVKAPWNWFHERCYNDDPSTWIPVGAFANESKRPVDVRANVSNVRTWEDTPEEERYAMADIAWRQNGKDIARVPEHMRPYVKAAKKATA
jgi:hypothetical protein